MYRVIRRPSEAALSESLIQFVNRKASRFESAFISLAAANVFLVSSAVSFYLLIRHS